MRDGGPMMRTFFRGWKRKLGIVALAMALMFLGVWVRSGVLMDSITTNFVVSRWKFISLCGRLWIRRQIHHENETTIEWRSSNLRNTVWAGTSFDPQFTEPPRHWRSDWAGFHIGSSGRHDPNMMTNISGSEKTDSYTVPYWSIVVPLTLLSACLLPLKPRPVNPAAPRATTAN